jgi:hypothetical protein
MAYDPRRAQAYNEAIAAGLSPEEAERAAGITDENAFAYVIGLDGALQENVIGPPKRPNEVIVPRGQDPGIDDEDEDLFQNARVTSQSTTTTQTTQITGGGSTTQRVVPTQYENNATSNAIQAQANDLEAQKQARKDAIRAAGGSGADVLRDPEFRRLSNAQTAKEYEAEQARTAVPNTGGIVTTVTPGVNQTITTQTVDGDFVTTRGSGFDPQAQAVDANEPSVVPARNFTAVDVTDPFEVDGAGIGLTDEEVFAQDNPITPVDTEDTFAGPGYGFEYDEDGELIPAADPFRPDVFDADEITPDSDPALDTGRFATATPDDIAPVRRPEAPLDLTYQYNDVDGYDIFDADGNYITTVNDEAQAILYIQDAEAEGLGYAADQDTLFNADTAETQAANAEAAQDAAGKEIAQQQFTLQQRNNTTTQGDWRVRIRLLPGASYLYRDSVNYLMQPLRDSDGVVFPYVPTITTNYVARYDPYELVHANYRGFFYKNSHVGEIQINGTFTAQDTAEATYLLAVIHFFRSCTKMFYGQDSEFRGSPPPLVELSGYGEFQFNNHPCLVSNFNYTLPNGVDYIRVSPNNQGVNLSNRRNPISTGGVTLDSVANRLTNNNLTRGAEPGRIDLGFSQGVNGTGQTSYVPTKMEIQLTMLPVQTREQVSKGFRLDEFARGNLLRGGFW